MFKEDNSKNLLSLSAKLSFFKYKLVLILFLLVIIISLIFACTSAYYYGGEGQEKNKPIQQLKVLNVYTDPNFENTGKIYVSFMPIGTDGEVILKDNLEIRIYQDLDKPLLYVEDYIVHYPERTKPWSFIINLDSSQSMRTNDPERLRVKAVKLFVNAIIHNNNADSTNNTTNTTPLGAQSLFAIADFGAGHTSGFYNSRLLTDFTNFQEDIDKALEEISEVGETPLFESTMELMKYLIDEISEELYNREMLILSDGEPNNTDLEKELYNKANNHNITINTIALGDMIQSDVMNRIAENTDGISVKIANAQELINAFEMIAISYTEGYIELILKSKNPMKHFGNSKNKENSFNLTVTSGNESISTVLSFNPNSSNYSSGR